VRRQPQLSLLDAAALEVIHERTLEVLWSTGARYASRRALDVLQSAGARIDRERGVAHIPAHLVESALGTVPRTCLLAGRAPGTDALLDGSYTFVTLDGSAAGVLDHRSGERRRSTARDLAEAVTIGDYLPEVGIMWGAVVATDAPPNAQVPFEMATITRSTGKHVQNEVQRPEEVPYVLDLFRAACDDGQWHPERPVFSVTYCPVSPLQHEKEMSEAVMALAPQRVPIAVYSLALSGATAPLTLAGAIVQTNAEILSSVVLFQAVQPGCPMIYVADCGILDLRAGVYVCAGPEAILMNLGLTELARFYGLPVSATGFSSDAKETGMSCGLDDGSTSLASMLARCDLLYGIGLLDAAQMLFLPKMVMDAEVVRQWRRVVEGVVLDDEHLAVGLIDEVGPGGHFLKTKATRRAMRAGEHVQPSVFLRGTHGGGVCSDALDLERAALEVERILAEHTPPPLPPGGDERVEEILAAAVEELSAR
jgi:trimethylamine---corrinoid protein Co-methyltransferase